ncbi:MAG TPA: deoxyhypusine synthase [Candidatus Polarisedimenticolaceae bacterium]|nr:deoxyhypusine synthase [Candidatus Polarisedimenticolaceae bacterium]
METKTDKLERRKLLSEPVEHIDIKSFDATEIVRAMRKMSFTARDLGRACEIFQQMLEDPDCSIVLSLAGSTSAGGCMQVYVDMVEHGMIDAVVATGASIIDMDFFEALGFRHYRGSTTADDRTLRELYIDRIYDTYIDENELQACDAKIKEIADSLAPGVYSSRGFIRELGRWLAAGNAKKSGSLVETAYRREVPIFCPAFSDSSAGFGLVIHQHERPAAHVAIDSVRDFRELTEMKIAAETTGMLIVGGGVPKNFLQDTVICAELLGREVPMHKYAIQITVADARDGACSSSTLKEACSWGKVDVTYEQMVYAEATSVIPLLGSHAYHTGAWRDRAPRRWGRLYD